MLKENSSGRIPRLHLNQKREVITTSKLESLQLQNKSSPLSLPTSNYDGNVVTCKQPSTSPEALPVHNLDCASGSESYFKPATGLDFLIGVPEVLLLQTLDGVSGASTTGSKFLVKIPRGRTLYVGIENSSAIQKALFCSGRNFNMSFLDPIQHEAATFIRKGAFKNIGICVSQEMLVHMAENDFLIGRVMQDNAFSTVSYTIFDDKNQNIFKILGSQNSFFGRLNDDVHFSILDPVYRTGGVILRKWDSEYSDFVYHIIFPSCDISVHNKMLLIGAALLVEYSYFKKSMCLCFS